MSFAKGEKKTCIHVCIKIRRMNYKNKFPKVLIWSIRVYHSENQTNYVIIPDYSVGWALVWMTHHINTP